MKMYGSGPGASTAGWIAHGVAEQHDKQSKGTFGFPWGYNLNHFGAGIEAEERVTGYDRGRENSSLYADSQGVLGSVTVPYTKDGQTGEVTTTIQHGNITGVTRK